MKDFTMEVETSLDLLFKVNSQASKKKKLWDKARTLYLQVVLFKVPYLSGRRRKFVKLKHSLHGDAPEICLFVPNRRTGVEYKKTTDELIDFCVEHYTELLEKHKVKGITTVMPLKQLQSEYGAYELRRKLVQRFDLFLCKNSLLYNSRFLTSLGKTFRVANKEPLGVAFPNAEADFDGNFQKNIERAIFTSSFYINSFSDNYCIPVGTMAHSKAELQENVEMVLSQVLTEDIIPGGFGNIRALYLWPSQSKPVPLYLSTGGSCLSVTGALTCGHSDKVPVAEAPVGLKLRSKSKRKRPEGVEGEISTLPGKKVCVMPNGEVFVTKADGGSEGVEGVDDSEEDEDSLNENSEEEEEEEGAEEDESEEEVEQREIAE